MKTTSILSVFTFSVYVLLTFGLYFSPRLWPGLQYGELLYTIGIIMLVVEVSITWGRLWWINESKFRDHFHDVYVGLKIRAVTFTRTLLIGGLFSYYDAWALLAIWFVPTLVIHGFGMVNDHKLLANNNNHLDIQD